MENMKEPFVLDASMLPTLFNVYSSEVSEDNDDSPGLHVEDLGSNAISSEEDNDGSLDLKSVATEMSAENNSEQGDETSDVDKQVHDVIDQPLNEITLKETTVIQLLKQVETDDLKEQILNGLDYELRNNADFFKRHQIPAKYAGRLRAG